MFERRLARHRPVMVNQVAAFVSCELVAPNQHKQLAPCGRGTQLPLRACCGR